MPVRTSKATRWALGGAVGIACLFISESGPMTQGASLITQANARMRHQLTPPSHAGVARRTSRRATVRSPGSGTIYLGSFGSNSVGVSYGYAPGTYGGVGCFPNTYGAFVCP